MKIAEKILNVVPTECANLLAAVKRNAQEGPGYVQIDDGGSRLSVDEGKINTILRSPVEPRSKLRSYPMHAQNSLRLCVK